MITRVRAVVALLCTTAALAAACRGRRPTPYVFSLPAGVEPPEIPADNPLTLEKVALGRRLFYDRRLSANATQACADCHRQALAFSDGRPRAIGSTGAEHPRNAPALVNVAYYRSLTWANPELVRLEDQLRQPLFGTTPVEMGAAGREHEILDRLAADRELRARFAAAFPDAPDPVTFDHAIAALASFVRTLISADSPFDRYSRGDASALSPAARRGLALFNGPRTRCAVCHAGVQFSTATTGYSFAAGTPFANIGLYDVDGAGGYPARDRGLYDRTRRGADMGRFRTPGLRNVSVTAPYMHDGSAATLHDVLDVYLAGGREITAGPDAGDGRQSPFKDGRIARLALTDLEQSDLLAFLDSLTDRAFLTDPRFAPP